MPPPHRGMGAMGRQSQPPQEVGVCEWCYNPPPGAILGVGDPKWLFARENSLGRPGPGPKPAPGWGCACCGAQSACPLPLVGTEKPGPKASDGCLRWVPPAHAYGGDAPGLGWGGGKPAPDGDRDAKPAAAENPGVQRRDAVPRWPVLEVCGSWSCSGKKG